jgi:hypothetical protein
MNYLKRAWLDTNRLLGGTATYIAIIALPVIGLAFHFLLDGYAPMSGEAHIWVFYMLAPLGAAFFLLFIWNLIAAPYRIEKERADRLERTLKSQDES